MEYLSLIICLAGAAIYAISTPLNLPAWLAELARIAFAVGLLGVLFGK